MSSSQRPLRIAAAAFLVLLVFLPLFTCHLHAARRGLSAAELASIRSVSDFSFSNDSKTLYLISNHEGARDVYAMDAATAVMTRLTQSAEPSRLQLSRDGNKLSYFSAETFHILDISTRKPAPLSEWKLEVDSYDWMPGGQSIIVAGRSHQRTDIWKVPLDGSAPIRLTETERDELLPQVSPDGKRLLFLRRSSDYFSENDLVIFDLETRAERVVVAQKGIVFAFYPFGAPFRWGPDGKSVYFLSARSGWDKVWRVDAAGGLPAVQVTQGDGEDRAFQVLADGSLLFVSNRGGIAVDWALWKQDPAGRTRKLFGGGGTVLGPKAATDGTVAFLATTPVQPAELFLLPSGGPAPGAARQLTRNLPASIARSTLVSATAVRFRTDEDAIVDAVLYVPPEATPEKRVPAIVALHGGPSMQDSLAWSPSRQILAQNGYVVISPNYRGSIGSGRAFEEADRLRIGDVDHTDVLMTARGLRNFPVVDRDRLGIFGTSYGGYLTNLTIGLAPGLFRAAVSWFGISDWPSLFAFEGLNPVVYNFLKNRMGLPHEHPGLHRQASPVTYVGSIEAPLLLVHGTKDRIVPPEQSRMLHSRLAELGKKSELILYEGEGHGWNRRENVEDAYNRMVEWFDRYLKSRQ